ncbi:MAG: Dipeptidyl carboxypeptidase [Verrucomicrobia subdivision 3 bacterium]|nr:Dipeptidyl carboxypeptidase [Limisphaerales bacterium]MCS1415575.1 Dipeptidyl carboxypeptidase [Limisphaerales bacterium]
MLSNMNSPEYQELASVIRPLLSGVYDQIFFNGKLFKHMTAAYQNRRSSNLNPEQLRLVEQTYEGFIRRRVRLNASSQKERIGAINQELAKLLLNSLTVSKAARLLGFSSWTNELDGLLKPLIASYQDRSQGTVSGRLRARQHSPKP